jgi:hypothetical protein
MLLTPVERVRHWIAEQLSQLSSQSVGAMHETILIRNGLFCGRKFQWLGYEVVWFLEEDQVKFFGPCGNLLSTASLINFMQDDQVHPDSSTCASFKRHAA